MAQDCGDRIEEQEDREGTSQSTEVHGPEFIVLIRGRDCEKTLDRCMRSLVKQTYPKWRAMILLDAPQDNSNLVAHMWRSKDPRIEFRMHTDHWGLCRSMYEIIQVAGALLKPSDDAVAAFVDADDTLSKHALGTVVGVYREKPKTLITHGSYVKMSKGRRTKISKPYPGKGDIRKFPWRGSHLKTVKWVVVKQAREDWFQHKGEWLTAASDLALMFGCIELAGLKRVEFVERCIYHWYDKWTPEKAAAQKYCEKKLRAK